MSHRKKQRLAPLSESALADESSSASSSLNSNLLSAAGAAAAAAEDYSSGSETDETDPTDATESCSDIELDLDTSDLTLPRARLGTIKLQRGRSAAHYHYQPSALEGRRIQRNKPQRKRPANQQHQPQHQGIKLSTDAAVADVRAGQRLSYFTARMIDTMARNVPTASNVQLAQLAGVSTKTVARYLAKSHSEVEALKNGRGGNTTNHPAAISDVRSAKMQLIRLIKVCSGREGRSLTASMAKDWLVFKNLIGAAVSLQTVRVSLRRMGFVWRTKSYAHKTRSSNINSDPIKLYQAARYLDELAELRSLKDPPAECHYDESYCHVHHASRHTWELVLDPNISAEERDAVSSAQSTFKGVRVIMFVAFISHVAPLLKVDLGVNRLTDPLVDARHFVWSDKKDRADYHVNTQTFTTYIEKCLLPALKKLARPVVLILDRDSAHMGLTSEFRINGTTELSKFTKAEMLSFLAKIELLRLERGLRSAEPNARHAPKNAKAKAAFVESVQAGLQNNSVQQLASLAQAAKSLYCERTWLQDRMEQHGIRVLYTPPRMSRLNPIELVFAGTKNPVAKLYHKGFCVS